MPEIKAVFWIGLFLVPLILHGNILVLVAFYKSKKLRHLGAVNPVFTSFLAVADILTAIVTFPLMSATHFIVTDLTKDATLCLLGCSMFGFTASASGTCLVFIAMERYINILHPYWAHLITPKRCLAAILLELFLHGIVAFLPSMGWNLQSEFDNFDCNSYFLIPKGFLLMVQTFACCTFLITTFCYIRIFTVAYKQCFKIKTDLKRLESMTRKFESTTMSTELRQASITDHEPPHRNNDRLDNHEETSDMDNLYKKEKTYEPPKVTEPPKVKCHHSCPRKGCIFKVVKTSSLILGIFYVTWLPTLILLVIISHKDPHSDKNYRVLFDFHYWSFILIMIQAGLNPIIYAWRINDFRRIFRKICFNPVASSTSVSIPAPKREFSGI